VSQLWCRNRLRAKVGVVGNFCMGDFCVEVRFVFVFYHARGQGGERAGKGGEGGAKWGKYFPMDLKAGP
jgi:hypothetical protein